MCLYMYVVFTVSQFHADVHSVYLVFLFDTTILSESMRMSNMFWLDLKSPYSVLICSTSAFSQHQYLLPWLSFLCISFDLQKERTKERKEPFFSNRELLSMTKHWIINPSLAQAHHPHYRHIAFISIQLKISTPFRKLSTKKKYITFNSFFVLF